MAVVVERRTTGIHEPVGIEPVPPELRKLRARDVGVLWGDLGIGLLVLVTGALLVPGLGFMPALAAIVVGSIIGVFLLSLGAWAGADHGVPTMVLFRPVLGLRGSWLPAALNVVQLVGWTAVELWAMSHVADLVSTRVFGFSSRGVWLGVFAMVCTGLALWGPVGVTRVWLERFGVWVIGGICLAVTALAVSAETFSAAVSSPGAGGFPTWGAGLDLVIAMPISWLPLVADYTRFARGPRTAFGGTFVGYLVANVWLYALGALLVLQAGATPSPEGVAAGILAIAGGSLAALMLLVGLLVGETDEAFANIYSGAVSLQNIVPRISQRGLIVGIAIAGTALAAVFDVLLYESFLFLIGSVFVPLFGLLIADHFVLRRGTVTTADLYDEGGRYWFTRGVRWRALIPWAAGFAVYHAINPSPVSAWMDLVGSVVGEPLTVRWPWLCASLPSLAVAFLLALILGRDISSGRSEPLRK